MIKGLYSAVSALVMNTAKQQLLSHNIANMDTPGFKQVLVDATTFMQDQQVYSQETSSGQNPSYLGLLGLGTQVADEYVDLSQGTLDNTGNQLDFALQGNGFFTVKTPDGTRYTRDGRFIRDAKNNLVTVDGYQVLDDTGKAITLPDGDVSVASDGAITVAGKAVAKLGIGEFAKPETELKRTEGNLFTGPAASTGKDVPQVVQGAIETSNADPARMMTQLSEVARSYEAAQKLVQNQDELLGKAIQYLGHSG